MSTEPRHILIVDDDTRLLSLLRRYLGDNGFRVTTATDAVEADRALSTFSVDLVVLDVMMPGQSGFEVARNLRETSAVPILFLTAMASPEDRVEGLEAGADDYLAKPFEPRELVLRIGAILRRIAVAQGTAPVAVAPLVFGCFEFDPERLELRHGAGAIRLTGAEATLLERFVRQPGVPLSRDELAAQGEDGVNARSVDVQINRLRRKIEPDPRYPRYLQTVRGKGYMLVPG